MLAFLSQELIGLVNHTTATHPNTAQQQSGSKLLITLVLQVGQLVGCLHVWTITLKQNAHLPKHLAGWAI